MITIIHTPKRKLPPPEPLPRISEDMARKLTADFWHGIALGAVIGAGLLAMALSIIGRI